MHNVLRENFSVRGTEISRKSNAYGRARWSERIAVRHVRTFVAHSLNSYGGDCLPSQITIASQSFKEVAAALIG
jgi:hypothetical protein